MDRISPGKAERKNGLVAQLGERCVRNAEVEGSNPFRSTRRHSRFYTLLIKRERIFCKHFANPDTVKIFQTSAPLKFGGAFVLSFAFNQAVDTVLQLLYNYLNIFSGGNQNVKKARLRRFGFRSAYFNLLRQRAEDSRYLLIRIPDRIVYFSGQDNEIDLSGLEITLQTAEGTEQTMLYNDIEFDFMFTVTHDIDFDVAGVYTVYIDNGEFSCQFPVQVID